MKPICPKCNKVMGKAGKAWSGLNAVQRWKCYGCGGTKLQGAYGGKK